ncbi:MAG: 50S ribosomal protein L31 [Candidatus Moranbacteria bacterium CG_4_9_14_3_um_filter_42_9]|nr:MAG: 50S ribosomal protein L31 [Candidatus Moranbacteria bacterium CG_4_9_14_3_um_filter_42_9]
MKKEIHPKYYSDAQIICSCGNVIKTGSTVKEMKVEICSACHPFYTGKKKMMDTTGRVDRFKKMAEKTAQKKEAAKKLARNASRSDASGAKADKKAAEEAPAKKPKKKAKPAQPGKK